MMALVLVVGFIVGAVWGRWLLIAQLARCGYVIHYRPNEAHNYEVVADWQPFLRGEWPIKVERDK